MKGLIASVLKLKPLIGVEKVNGTYVQLGQVRTFERAHTGPSMVGVAYASQDVFADLP